MARRWLTSRLELRQMSPADAELICAYGLRSREYHRPWDPIRAVDHWELPVVRRRLGGELEQAEAGNALVVYLTALDAPGVVIGRVALSNIVRGVYLGCTAGYGLAPEATGRGYMTEALTEVVRIAFDEMGLHRVEANVVPRNQRSLDVAERCGFVVEGMSPRYLKINGRWEDHVRLARRNEALEGDA